MYDNSSKIKNNSQGILKNPLWWLLFLPAAITAVIICIIPLFRIFALSFTDFDMVSAATFNGISNYLRAFVDDVGGLIMLNTAAVLFLGGGFILLLGWMIGASAGRLPSPIGLVILTLLGALSICSFIDAGWSILFSSDSYGFINSQLISAEVISEPIAWGSKLALFFVILKQIGICLAPIYAIFYIGYRNGKIRHAWHIAVSAVPILLVANGMAGISIIGYPSTEYKGDWLVTYIYDYVSVRYDIGYGCALIILLLAFVILFVAVGNLAVWGLSHIKYQPSKKLLPLYIVGSGLGLLSAVPVFSSIFILASWSFRPIDEMFEFPTSLFVKRPTLQSFISFAGFGFASGETGYAVFSDLILYLALATLLFLIIILPTAVLLAFMKSKILSVISWCWLGLMCVSPFTALLQLVLFSSMTDRKIPVIMLSLVITPMLPLCVLLTAFMLRKAADGVENFRGMFKSVKNWVILLLAPMTVIPLYSLAALFCKSNMIYSENNKFIFSKLSLLFSGGMTRMGVASVAMLTLLLIGLLLSLAAIIVISLLPKHKKKAIHPNY